MVNPVLALKIANLHPHIDPFRDCQKTMAFIEAIENFDKTGKID